MSWVPACIGQEAPPPALTVPLQFSAELRYGENPHQPAAFYTDQSLAEHSKGGVATATQHHGKEVKFGASQPTAWMLHSVADCRQQPPGVEPDDVIEL